jgi:hypothetical protein
MAPDYVDIAGAAAMLGVRPETITQYRWRGDFPPPDLEIASHPAWLRETLEAWIASRRGKGWRAGQTGKRPQN